jgi:anti-sigma regulatory factor (Ser/Thr protein kinase)
MLAEMERMVTVPLMAHRPRSASFGWSMDARFDAHPGSLRVARKIASSAALAAGATSMAAFELETALGEALINAFVHAYGGDPRGRILVHIEFTDRGIHITVRDAGRTLAAAPAIPDHLRPEAPAGRGLFIMSKLMDQVEVIHPDRRGRGTAIRMSKRFSAH